MSFNFLRLQWYILAVLLILVCLVAYNAIYLNDQLREHHPVNSISIPMAILDGLLIYFGGSLLAALGICTPLFFSRSTLWTLTKIATPIFIAIGIWGGLMTGGLIIAAPYYITAYIIIVGLIFLVVRIRDRFLMVFQMHPNLFKGLLVAFVIVNLVVLGGLLHTEITNRDNAACKLYGDYCSPQ